MNDRKEVVDAIKQSKMDPKHEALKVYGAHEAPQGAYGTKTIEY